MSNSEKVPPGLNEIKLLIKEHRKEIRQEYKAGVVGIFGSYARGEKPGIDVDLLVNFDTATTLFGLVGLGDYLEELLGLPVDVVSKRALHPRMQADVLKEMVILWGLFCIPAAKS
ncbi:DNA polymerase subunit beta [Methanohalophilus sp. RSK]|uniref:nucleotidyltransferase family protein n=1 Tax=Methanohalophilus sp. RSK TaxID=2485783 RepID=UPI000F4396F3|nr:nucleotidyltransferase family protein [Methanohalophilus sp. RSK]RNI15747.1 DNA polymerase subunit beta [Methanohalophilus sp. RSK]